MACFQATSSENPLEKQLMGVEHLPKVPGEAKPSPKRKKMFILTWSTNWKQDEETTVSVPSRTPQVPKT